MYIIHIFKQLRYNHTVLTTFLQNLLQPHATAPLPEYKTVSIQKSRFILTHYGMLKTCWDLVILLATVYVAVIVPYYAAFLEATRNSVLDIVVGTLFFCGE